MSFNKSATSLRDMQTYFANPDKRKCMYEKSLVAELYYLVNFRTSQKWNRYFMLGVPAVSRILTGDSQKLSFSILTKVPFLIFWWD